MVAKSRKNNNLTETYLLCSEKANRGDLFKHNVRFLTEKSESNSNKFTQRRLNCAFI